MNNVVSFQDKFIKDKALKFGLSEDEVRLDYEVLQKENKLNELDHMLEMRKLFSMFADQNVHIEIIFVDENGDSEK